MGFNIVNLFLILAVLSARHGAMAARQLSTAPASTTTSNLDAVMSYWKQALPGTEMPANLQEIVSPLSSSLVSLFSDHFKQTNSGPHDSFCEAARISCDVEEFDKFRTVIKEAHGFPAWIPTSTAMRGTVEYELNSDGKKVRKHADFFRESELLMPGSGGHLALGYERDHNPERAFLPRSLAQSIGPVSVKKLPQQLQDLGIAQNSRLANEMTTTTVGCSLEPLQGEIRKCVTSIEDMVDFVRSQFASGHPQVLTLSSTDQDMKKNLQVVRPATVTKVVQSSSSESKSMVCHSEMYSSALYVCHDIGNTRVYTVTLQADDDDKSMIKNLIALCHQDTSQWTPEHVAFYDLGVKPGESEACHWIHERDVVFAEYS